MPEFSTARTLETLSSPLTRQLTSHQQLTLGVVLPHNLLNYKKEHRKGMAQAMPFLFCTLGGIFGLDVNQNELSSRPKRSVVEEPARICSRSCRHQFCHSERSEEPAFSMR